MIICQNLVFRCLKIEGLYLKRCKKLENLLLGQIHPRLNVVHVYRCHDIKNVEINVPNLQEFGIHGRGQNLPSVLNFVACNKLKELTLTDTSDIGKWFWKHLSEFPALEVLVMNDSYI